MGMRRIFGALLLIRVAASPASAQDILGSGSTFCYPLIVKWTEEYARVGGAHIVFQPIGSSAGLTEIRQGVVDFAVSEAPLNDAQLLRDGLAQFPLAIGAIVPVVNVDGIAAGQLRVTGALLADIYLGKVTKWNDPAIAALNPELKLPAQTIQVMHRSDGSGTTFMWTDYLSRVSDEWKVRVGENTTVAWPTGFGGRGNGGVADNVARVRGAIGYVDYTYAARAKLAFALVRNRAGNFISPTRSSFDAAIDGVDWLREPDFYIFLNDAPGTDAYPIMATSFALTRAYPKDPDRARAMRAFLRWALESGQELARAQEYVPLPSPLVRQVEKYWDDGKP